MIGLEADATTLFQHYFGSRGIARVDAMTFASRVWSLQRFSRELRSLERLDRRGLERSHDGAAWEYDSALTADRVHRKPTTSCG
jgi:hypothetical protein